MLLSLGFSTGRRVSELTGLRAGELAFSGTTQMRVFWRRTKGGRSHTDTITDGELIALMRSWINQLYGSVKAASKEGAVGPATATLVFPHEDEYLVTEFTKHSLYMECKGLVTI